MQCNCNNYNYNEQVAIKQPSWEYLRKVYMGILYRCKCCGSLWVGYSSGHGWTIYYKKPSDINFKEQIELSESTYNYEFTNVEKEKWNDILKKIPKEKDKVFQGVIIPYDVMSILKYLFVDDKIINKWLCTYRNKNGNFDIPIEIIKNHGINVIKGLLLAQIEKREIESIKDHNYS